MNLRTSAWAMASVIVASGCAPGTADETESTRADELSVSQARCTMQSASTCVASPDALCREAERVDQPSVNATGCVYLRDANQCMCPRRPPTPRPTPCDPVAPWVPRPTGTCHMAPPDLCMLFDRGVPVAARPPSVSGCVRQGNLSGVGQCWCPD